MKRNLISACVALGIVALGAWIVAAAPPAFSEPAAGSVSAPADEASLHRAYAEAIGEADAAADRWRRHHVPSRGLGMADDELLAAENHGCPEGTQFWRRDRVSELCVSLCASDVDCGPDEGRCRILDTEDRDRAPAVVLVDDLPTAEVDTWLAPLPHALAPPMMVCDPLFDVDGAVDADLASAP